MATITFDTFENVKRLKAVGFTEEQAAEQTKIIAELVEDRLVTREYLDEKLALTEMKIIRWVAGMLVAQAAIVATLVKLL
jgi:hypothetical protein